MIIGSLIIGVVFLVVWIAIFIALCMWISKTRGNNGSVLVLILILIFFIIPGIAYGFTRNWDKINNKI